MMLYKEDGKEGYLLKKEDVNEGRCSKKMYFCLM